MKESRRRTETKDQVQLRCWADDEVRAQLDAAAQLFGLCRSDVMQLYLTQGLIRDGLRHPPPQAPKQPPR